MYPLKAYVHFNCNITNVSAVQQEQVQESPERLKRSLPTTITPDRCPSKSAKTVASRAETAPKVLGASNSRDNSTKRSKSSKELFGEASSSSSGLIHVDLYKENAGDTLTLDDRLNNRLDLNDLLPEPCDSSDASSDERKRSEVRVIICYPNGDTAVRQ